MARKSTFQKLKELGLTELTITGLTKDTRDSLNTIAKSYGLTRNRFLRKEMTKIVERENKNIMPTNNEKT